MRRAGARPIGPQTSWGGLFSARDSRLGRSGRNLGVRSRSGQTGPIRWPGHRAPFPWHMAVAKLVVLLARVDDNAHTALRQSVYSEAGALHWSSSEPNVTADARQGRASDLEPLRDFCLCDLSCVQCAARKLSTSTVWQRRQRKSRDNETASRPPPIRLPISAQTDPVQFLSMPITQSTKPTPIN